MPGLRGCRPADLVGSVRQVREGETMSDKPSIVEALAEVMRDVDHVGKKERNTQQGFNFRGIDAVLNAVGPALRKHGVVVVPELLTIDRSTVEIGQKRTLMGYVIVTVRYTFHGPAGDSIASETPGEAMDSGDKAVSKAMSVAFRTALLQALALPTDEPDPDSEAFERAPAFSLKDHIAEGVGTFELWDENRRRVEWKEATDGPVKTREDADAVLGRMRAAYTAEFPAEVEGQEQMALEGGEE